MGEEWPPRRLPLLLLLLLPLLRVLLLLLLLLPLLRVLLLLLLPIEPTTIRLRSACSAN